MQITIAPSGHNAKALGQAKSNQLFNLTVPVKEGMKKHPFAMEYWASEWGHHVNARMRKKQL